MSRANGSQTTGSINSTSIYTLACTGTGGTATQSTTVTCKCTGNDGYRYAHVVCADDQHRWHAGDHARGLPYLLRHQRRRVDAVSDDKWSGNYKLRDYRAGSRNVVLCDRGGCIGRHRKRAEHRGFIDDLKDASKVSPRDHPAPRVWRRLSITPNGSV